MNRVNFDPLAVPYKWLERLTFGPYLHRCRIAFLEELKSAESILILGDGDGRFLEALLNVNPTARIESLDISPAMVKVARDRVASDHVHFRVEDARTAAFETEGYDVIVTNFFLDCFQDGDLNRLVAKLIPALQPGGRWIVGDFRELPGRVPGFVSRSLLAGMYLAFAIVTRIPASRLVDPDPILRASGLVETKSLGWLGGFLRASLWEKPTAYFPSA